MFKKFLVLAAAAAIALMAGTALANGNGAGIANSPHDFSGESWNFRAEICRTCHVPHDHGRNEALGGLGLLWNHQTTSQTYLMYAEDTHIQFIDGAADAEPTGTTKMCLGCHDGTVGLDQFDAQANNAGTVFIGGGDVVPNITTGDLSNTHPLGVVYDAAADGGLFPMTNAMGNSGTIQDVLETGNKIACMSCHDVHDAPGEAVPGTHLLRVANTVAAGGAASGLCLTCHNK